MIVTYWETCSLLCVAALILIVQDKLCCLVTTGMYMDDTLSLCPTPIAGVILALIIHFI